MTYEEKMKILVDYMKLKIEEKDWHGVCDCANDLRELEVEIKMKKTEPPKIFVTAGKQLDNVSF